MTRVLRITVELPDAHLDEPFKYINGLLKDAQARNDWRKGLARDALPLIDRETYENVGSIQVVED
jgi:hypothetical protein